MHTGTERATTHKEDRVLKKNNPYSSKLSAFLKDVPMPSRIPPQLYASDKIMSNETDTEADTEEDEGNNSLPRNSDKAAESNQMDAEETSNWKNVNLSLGPMDDEYDEDIFENEAHLSYDSHQHCTSPAMMPLPYSPSAMTSFFSHDRILPSEHEEKSFEDGGFRGKTNTHEKTKRLQENQRVIEDLTMKLSAVREAHLREKEEFLAQLDQEKEEVERLRACNLVQAAEIEELSKLLESAIKDAQNSKDNEEAARHAARIAFAARDVMQAQLEL
uniref:AlNc14C2009G13125 protein n=1 Tax=Albugo laibachii Nc14 TaxID=890382 RepID=F0X2W0_9STRA|nr:AlNc14C2009G13125 [Albugo laibachii Nc14]|eukprot:CCA28289.1 AlNc14C2009G13125 [Albugo laibachii Nc14]